MRYLTIITALFLLTGCSVIANSQRVVYNTHGKSSAQFAADRDACEYEVNKAYAGADNSIILAEWQHMFHQCLRSKGYTPQ